jgi:hypothetical protein
VDLYVVRSSSVSMKEIVRVAKLRARKAAFRRLLLLEVLLLVQVVMEDGDVDAVPLLTELQVATSAKVTAYRAPGRGCVPRHMALLIGDSVDEKV